MTIDEKTIIKYLDIVILKSTDISRFNAFTTLSDILDFDNKNEDEKKDIFSLSDSVQRIGVTYKYFEQLEYEINIFRLTKEGIRAKEKGGHLKYQEFLNKNPFTLYQKIYLTFFICFGLFGVYKVLQPTVSVSEFDKLKNDFDSLKTEFDSNKRLNSKPTLKLSNDTLQTKN